MLPDNIELQPVVLLHLPLVRDTIDRLGIYSVVDKLLPRDPRSEVSDADCITVMIMNILMGRIALYRMDNWLDQVDTDILLWEGCPRECFGDVRLATALDHLFDQGTDEVLSAVVHSYLHSDEAPDVYSVHTDTTSLSLYGDYDIIPDMDAPTVTFGHSKAHRPDLKQVIFGMTLHGAVGMPMAASMLDGNTSDHDANRLQIAQLASMVRPDDEVTFVADCKLVDKHTIGQLLDEEFHFISLLPNTFTLRKQLIDTAHEQGHELLELARDPGRTKASPDRVYRGTSYECSFPVQDPHVPGKEGLRTERMRFLLIESSQLAAKFDNSLEDKLEREARRFDKAIKKSNKKPFSCHDDAAKKRDKLVKTLKLHRARVDVIAEEVTLKRSRPGRPRKGEEPPTETRYRLVLGELTADTDAIEQARLYARHFVLITDHLDEETWSDERVFAEYRKQHLIENHSGFRWIKSEAAVAPMFLKTPRRIAALGLVFVLALMVRNYLQFALRQRLFEVEERVPYYGNRPDTAKPTTEVLFDIFAGVMVNQVIEDGEIVERRLANLSDAARRVLELLDVAVEVFTRVREKPVVWVGGIP